MISEVKREIEKTIAIGKCCSYAFLNSLFSNAKIEYSINRLNIELPQFLHNSLEKLVNATYPNITLAFDGDKVSLIGKNIEQFLWDIGLELNVQTNNIDVGGINESMLETDCCKYSYIKGLFLLLGNFYYNKNNNENSYGYLVEFVFKDYAMADDTKALMKFMGIKVGANKRGSSTVLYLKDSETICDLFVKMGAVKTALEIQNNLLIREMRNDANRQGNCFDANLNKTLNASREQIKAIDYIIKNYGLDYLDENLREIALLRLANTDITLQEMQKLYSTEISRAGLKYKLDRIIKIYKDLTNKK